MATVHRLEFVPHRPRGCAGCFEDGSAKESPVESGAVAAPAPGARGLIVTGPLDEVAWAALPPAFEVNVGAEILLPAMSGPEGGLHIWGASGPGVHLVGGLATGTARVRGMRPGRVEVTYTYAHSAGLVKVATVVEVKPVLLEWRAWAKFGKKQFVNEDHPEASVDTGRDVELTCGVKPARAGIALAFTLEEIEHLEGAPAGARASLSRRHALTDVRGEAKVKVRLSTHGGDRYRVGVYLAEGDEDTPVVMSGEIQVWRKIYYQVTEMLRADGKSRFELPESLFAGMKKAYAKVFVDLEQAGKKGTAPYVRDALIDREERVRGTFERDWRAPLKLHFFSADLAVHPVDEVWLVAVTESPVTQEDSWIPVGPDDAVPLPGVLRAEYTTGTLAGWRTLPDGALQADRSPDGMWVTLRVDLGASAIAAADRPVLVRVRYRRAKIILGYQTDSMGASVTICRGMTEAIYRDEPAGLDRALVHVATHEAGHAFGLVGAEVAARSTSEPDHCAAFCTMRAVARRTSSLNFHVGKKSCAGYLRTLDLSRDGPRASIWEV